MQPIQVFPKEKIVKALLIWREWVELPEAYLLRLALFLGYDGIDDFFQWHCEEEELYVYSWISQEKFLGDLPKLKIEKP